ncbi:MAG: carboxypeptidase-like regulatory domain-containing protein, partial [Gemmatimonadetes bacterium]|nr:carboxypeptidase-like regulatory domain-containing protein [Gemmatimonadota bacterium]
MTGFAQRREARFPVRREALLRASATLLATACALAVLAGAPSSARAQGILFVRVSGKQGPIAHATVEVVQRDTVWRRADTDEHGAARFAAVLPGIYQVRVQAYGYRPYREEHVSVSGSSSTVLDVQMEAAPVPLEGLTVTSERVEIQHDNTEFNT